MKISCGILPYRIVNNQIEVFLVHPGGPFFAKKDKGFWGISKGGVNDNEDSISCAIREFKEETSIDILELKDKLISLGEIVQTNGKHVFAWAIEHNLEEITDEKGFADLREKSNRAQISLGIKKFEIPEIDKGRFFNINEVKEYMNEKQIEFVFRLIENIKKAP